MTGKQRLAERIANLELNLADAVDHMAEMHRINAEQLDRIKALEGELAARAADPAPRE